MGAVYVNKRYLFSKISVLQKCFHLTIQNRIGFSIYSLDFQRQYTYILHTQR